MKNICDNPIVQKLKSTCCSLAKTRIRGEYSASIVLYNEDAPDKADASHSCDGKIDQALVTALTVLGMVTIFASAVCCVRSIFRK